MSTIPLSPSSETSLPSLLADLPIMMWSRGEDGSLWFSESWLEFTGTTPEQQRQQPDLCIHPGDRKRRNQIHKRSAREQGSLTLEYRLKNKNGEYRWILETVAPPNSERGGHGISAGHCVDITAYKSATRFLEGLLEERTGELGQLQRQLDDTRHFYGTLVNATNKPIFDWDMTSDRLTGNEHLAELFGWESPMIEGNVLRKWLSVIHPDDSDRIQQQFNDHLKGGQSQWDSQYRMRTRTGSYLYVWARAHTVRDTSGRSIRMIGTIADVTNQKLSELLLRKSEFLYRTLVDTANEGIWSIDGNLRTVFANRRLAEMLGTTVDDVLQSPPWDFLPPKERAEFQTQQSYRQTGIGEARILRRDGKTVDVIASSQALIDEDGNFAGALGMFTDLTLRKEAEGSLVALSDRLRAIFEHAPIGIALIDSRGGIIAMNFPLQQMLGYSKAELHPLVCTELLSPTARVDCKLFHGIFPRTKSRVEVERSYMRFDGSEIWTRIVLSRLSEKSGDKLAIAMVEDFTQRRKSAEQLRHLARIVETTDDAILSTSAKGIVQSWNAGAEKLFGYTALEMIGRNERIMLPPEKLEAYEIAMTNTLKGQHSEHIQSVRIAKSGNRVPASITGSPIRDHEGKIIGVSKIARDLTEQKRTELLEQEFRQAQKLEGIGRLAGGVAHDFNNMLHAIGNWAQLLQLKLPAKDPLQRYADGILSATNRAAGLTRQLLAFSRKQILSPQLIDVNLLVEEASKMIRRLIGEDVDFEFIPAQDLLPIQADPDQIVQVLINLCVNARDAMPDGGQLHVRTGSCDLNESSASFPSLVPGLYTTLTVTDTGHGMSEEVKAHIFEPFFTTKEEGKGTGLGLATVYGIVQQSGGDIKITSEIGRGTTFSIYLPSQTKDLPQATEPAMSVNKEGTGVILVVEDEDGVRLSISEFLEDHGYTVLSAPGGPLALELAREFVGKIDLLITDVVMPCMTGRDLSDQLKASRPELKTLFISGYTDDKLAKHGVLEKGMVFLSKPFTFDALSSKIEYTLAAQNTEAFK